MILRNLNDITKKRKEGQQESEEKEEVIIRQIEYRVKPNQRPMAHTYRPGKEPGRPITSFNLLLSLVAGRGSVFVCLAEISRVLPSQDLLSSRSSQHRDFSLRVYLSLSECVHRCEQSV
ncbi:hypothetical protein RRG08_049921 [Elysia crispata]|uniref:Uncharacterized protein n=1 Tax=Elysia crispata TaxID=231223 RepID=A0AAE0XZS2_9GAST|nr:hypothetical protein RRG08_049921 [Elysia crispata]